MDYDVIIIGTGVAGSSVAYKLKGSGMSVAVVDKDRYGGTCAFHGCVPKKILSGISEIVDAGNRMVGNGVREVSSMDWTEAVRFKDELVHFLTSTKEKAFQEAGIDTYHGIATFNGKNSILIDGKVISAKYIVVAVGSRPATVNINGAFHLTTSDEFLDMTTLPKRIIFAGGGYISFEFAHMASRAGCDVLVVHRGEQVLKNFDPDIVKMLVEASEIEGIRVITGQEIRSIQNNDGSLMIHAYDSKNGNENVYECDMVVHGLGRVPAIDELKSEVAGVEVKQGGVAVNEFLQSVSNPIVYAAGDCIIPGPALTPTASLQANVVVSNILNGNQKTAYYSDIASAVFTVPPIASVGMMEKDVKNDHYVLFNDMGQFYSVKRTKLTKAASKVIIEKETKKISGAHIIGPDAQDTINIFALAIKAGLTTDQVKNAMYAYPSSSYDVRYMLK